jgi:hypothetical protein
MNARDELVGIVQGTKHMRALHLEVPAAVLVDVGFGIADAVLAAGYRAQRTITTVEELEALPDGSAVLDRYGDVSTKHAHWWHGYETSPLLSSKVAKFGPLTVIHEGA